MAFVVAWGRQPKLPTHQPITKSMYFRPRESVRMLPLVAATCRSAGRSLASGSRRRAAMTDHPPPDPSIMGNSRLSRFAWLLVTDPLVLRLLGERGGDP